MFVKVNFAQIDFANYTIKKLTPDDGLSQGSNYFRYEDSRGFMWITANDAVNRYDGSHVKVYNLDRYFKNCPNLQQGYGFAEDDKANVYIGSVRGLYIYNRCTDKFTLQKIFANAADDIAMPIGFKDGKIWCFNKKYQINSFDVKTKKVDSITTLPIEAIPSIHIYDLENNIFYYRWPFFDKNNQLWFVDRTTLFSYNCVSKKISKVNLTASVDNLFNASSYDSVTNNLAIATNKGLIIYNTISKQERQISKLKNVALGYVGAVAINNNQIAFVLKNAALLLDINSNKFSTFAGDFSAGIRLHNFSFDKANRLWVCEDGLGETFFNFSKPMLPKFPAGNTINIALVKYGVVGFAEFSNGDLIIPNSYFYNNATKQFSLKDLSKSTAELVNGRIETDLVNKGIWTANSNYVNSKINIGFKKNFQDFKIKYIIKEEDSIGNLQQLRVLNDGRLLAAFNSGLYWLQNGSYQKVQSQPYKNTFTINKLSANRAIITYLNSDAWLVQFTATNQINFVQKILPGVQCFYIQEDTVKHQYWIGANDGLYLLDKNFSLQKRFDANNGLAGTYMYGLLLDNDGNAWCSHQRGLSSINTTTFKIINYDKNDGIQEWDFNNRAFYKSSDGTLYFGGINGFNYFKPPLQSNLLYEPQVYIDEILVNNKIFLPDTSANEIQKININYANNNISFNVYIKDLESADYKKIMYRIKEQGTVWSTLPNKGTINFTSLAPGSYTLELGVYDKFANKEIVQKTIVIKISKPFYLSVFFWLFVALLGLVLFLWWLNNKKLQKQQQLLQQQIILEQQRLKITADLHDDIGATLSSLQVNSAVANQLLNKNDTAEAKRILSKIETQSLTIADKIGDIIWSMKPGKDEFMTLSSRIKNFANEILEATNIDFSFAINKNVDTEIQDISCRKNIVLITKEALNNAVKYSKAKNISIALKIEKNKILLTIKDDGIGFNDAITKGNGMANMKKRVEELSGLFVLKTKLGEGVEISCIMPLV